MTEDNVQYVMETTILKVVKDLGLAAPDDFCQDWEYVVADASRTEEFIAYYETAKLTINEKFALMIVVIASFNDLLKDKEKYLLIWERIKKQLERDKGIHENTMHYWALSGEKLENCFAVTPCIREVCRCHLS